jgi:hypothetical protein
MSEGQSAASLVASVRGKGVQLWSDSGRLRYRAPKGALTREEMERLAAASPEILALLADVPGDWRTSIHEPGRAHSRRAPLSYSQLAHWQLYGLRERPTIRHIAGAWHLHGPLVCAALQRSIAEVVRRHDALRTRIVVVDGAPMQEALEGPVTPVVVEDLSSLPKAEHEAAVRGRIDSLIHEPVLLSRGPLFEARLLKLGAHEHVLIAVMEHAIADMASVAVFVSEVLQAYECVVRRQPISLPRVALQFTDHATRQWDHHREWLEKHGRYWAERLEGGGRVRFPRDIEAPDRAEPGWGMAPIRIDRDLKERLQAWCRSQRTTLVMMLLTTYVASVMRWCRTSDAILQYAIDGRIDASAERAIGFFASLLYLRVRAATDDFVELLRTVTREYCQALEHADSYYLATQVPRPEFTRTAMFNFVPFRGDTSGPRFDALEASLTCEPIPCSQLMLKSLELDYEPMMVLFEARDEIVGGVHFARQRFSQQAMEGFTRLFRAVLESITSSTYNTY